VTTSDAAPLAVLVNLKPLPGRLEEVLEMTRVVFSKIRADEETCIFLSAHVDPEGKNVMLYELWSDRDTFNAFVQRPDMAEYLADLDTRLEGRSVHQWIRARA
jgi:quinol monooxygenase YgiN